MCQKGSKKLLMCSDEDVALSDPSEQGDSEEDKSDDVRLQEPSLPSSAPE